MLIDLIKQNMPNTRDKVDSRIKEFDEINKQNSDVWFNELCFCLLTANYSAEGGLKIQKAIQDGFVKLTQDELATELTKLGHRFPNMRASFIYDARKYATNIKEILTNEKDKRKWLINNIKGLGMKEASHFLRNIGFYDYAIIDRHIIRMLNQHDNYPLPKTITPKKYEEIESYLNQICTKLELKQGILDFYIWQMATGKILK